MAALDGNLHDLEHLGRAVDDALVDSGNTATGVERVFLTGSTIIVPAHRALFAGNFGAKPIPGDNEFVYWSPKASSSSASGLPDQCKEHSDPAVQGGTDTSSGFGSPHRQRLAGAL